MDSLNKAITRLARERAQLRTALKRLTAAANIVDGILDGDDDKAEAWQSEVEKLDKALDLANRVLHSTERH